MADLAVQANARASKLYTKEVKVGEGTYATVFKGAQSLLLARPRCTLAQASAAAFTGREVATGREIAIKKIKVGQFKDGLDMSAIREIKFLRELKHENVIEVRLLHPPLWTLTRLRSIIPH